MNKYSIGKRTIVAFSFLAIIIAVTSMGSGCSAGGTPEIDKGFDGSWTGEVKASDGNSSVVNLTLQSPSKAIKGKSTLTYEDPRSCVLVVKFSRNAGDNVWEYSLAESTGGFCDKLSLGKLTLKKQGDNSLACELTSLGDKSSAKISEKGTLRRSGK